MRKKFLNTRSILNIVRALVFIALLILFSGTHAFTQELINFSKVDRETHNHYTEQKWDTLIDLGEKALATDIDYFYLRLRMGIAYYQKKNYFMAAHHLEKAKQFNANDKTTLEYLFWAYRFTNRYGEAEKLSAGFSEEMADRFETGGVLNKIIAEAGPVLSNNISSNSLTADNVPNLYSEQDLYGDMLFLQAGADFNLSKFLSMYFSYDQLEVDKQKQILTSEIVKIDEEVIFIGEGIFPHNIYGAQKKVYSSNYTLHQKGFYASPTLYPGKGFIVAPAFHYLVIDYATMTAEPQVEQFYAQIYDTIPSEKIVYTIKTGQQRLEKSIWSLFLSKSRKILTFALQGSWSDLNFAEQLQFSGSVYWYPKGNLDLYVGTRFTHVREKEEKNWHYNQLVGGKIISWLWVEGLVSIGEMRNFTENNALVVHNSGDLMKFRTGANFIIPLYKKLELSLRYRYLSMETSRFNVRENESVYLQNISYTNQSIIGGLQWKF